MKQEIFLFENRMNGKPLKVLLTTGIYPPEIGGPATYSALLEREMPKFGIAVSVLPFHIVRNLPKLIRHLVFFLKVLKKGGEADVLYTQDPVSVGFPTMLAAKCLGKPFLARIAGDYAWEQATQRHGIREGIDEFQRKKFGWKTEILRRIESITAKHADQVITPSQYFRRLVNGWNPNKENVMTIYNGIDFSDFPEQSRDYEAKTIISAGRLVPWKGFDTLIELMGELPEWKLFIAGDGPEKDRLSNLIEKMHLKERVFLLGKMERNDLIAKIQRCEIFVLNTSFESFSFQIVEAMFAGVPVVSTNIGNISEIIDNGENGILVSPNDKSAIFDAVKKLSEDGDFRKKLTLNAKAKATAFSVERTLEKTSEVVRSLSLSKKRAFLDKKTLFRYLLAGITGASTQIGLLYIFTDIAGIWYIYSSLLAFVFAVIVSFTLQKFWTFADRDTKKIHHQFAYYMGVAISGILINTFFMYIFVDVFGIWYILAQIITGGIIAVFNFVMYRFFVFKTR